MKKGGKKGEKGYAVLDLIVTLALSSIVAFGAGVTTLQTMEVTQQNQDHSTTVRRVRPITRVTTGVTPVPT
jgi:type II secretory pathway component PulJ